ncbi:MAG: hypothetical protein Q8O55_13390 [Dehalococcoidales bacterium]|nr:hypothetical protein [Dehalococcoidales bacterium]
MDTNVSHLREKSYGYFNTSREWGRMKSMDVGRIMVVDDDESTRSLIGLS